MESLALTILGSLIATGICAAVGVTVRRHFVLVALSREIELVRVQLQRFQQVLREAENRAFEGPLVFRFRRYDRTRFSGLLQACLHLSPRVHESLVMFENAFDVVEGEFEEFAQGLAYDPIDDEDIAATSSRLRLSANRLFLACEIILRETARRELVAFPRTYRVGPAQIAFYNRVRSGPGGTPLLPP